MITELRKKHIIRILTRSISDEKCYDNGNDIEEVHCLELLVEELTDLHQNFCIYIARLGDLILLFSFMHSGIILSQFFVEISIPPVLISF